MGHLSYRLRRIELFTVRDAERVFLIVVVGRVFVKALGVSRHLCREPPILLSLVVNISSDDITHSLRDVSPQSTRNPLVNPPVMACFQVVS